MNLKSEYDKNIGESYASALATVVAANPSVTAAELKALVVEFPSLAGMTLADMLAGAQSNATPAKKTATKSATKKKPAKQTAALAAPPSKGGARPHSWNVRTAEGRAELDAAVLEGLRALGGENVAAVDLRARLGATPAQLREVLNRHIQAGLVTFIGKTRATRYSLA